MEITLDGSTKIVMADTLRIDRPRGEPLDFARDTILVVDPDTNRPVGLFRPVPGARAAQPAPKPEPTVRPEPARVPSMTPAVRVAPPPASVPVPNKGPLTEGQQEQIVRLWRLNPGRTVGWIGAEFARQTGRTLAPQTVEKYRPTDNRRPSDPSPDDIAAEAAAIRREREAR